MLRFGGSEIEWDSSDQYDSRVVGFERWRELGNFEGLKPRAGVYIFVNVNWQMKYIGKACAGRMISEIYRAIDLWKDFGATRVKALYTNSSEKAQSLERDLIEKYDPPSNLT